MKRLETGTTTLQLLEMDTEKRIWTVVEPYLAAEKVELDDLELVGRGRTRTLRVVVDGEGGLDLDRISELSRGLSRLLDPLPGLEGPYQLEVSTPGLERKLSRPAHYAKSIGREVVVKTGTVTLRGELIASGPQDLTLKLESGELRTVSFEDVVSARTVFRWESGPKPGQARKQS